MKPSYLRSLASVFEKTLPLLVFALLASYTYARFFLLPSVGFTWQLDGRISLVYVAAPETESLKTGDRLIRVGAVEWAKYAGDLRQPLFEDVRPGQIVPIVVERNGQTVAVPWAMPGYGPEELDQRLVNYWWLGYVFWLVGTATTLFARPKDERWRLFITFNYLTAIWFIAGATNMSSFHLYEGALVLRSFVWLSVPIYLHFHWVFPQSLANLPRFVWPLAHFFGLALAVAQWFQLLPPSLYSFGFFIAVLGSFILLAAHFVMRPQERGQIRFVFFFGSAALVLPGILGAVLSATGSATAAMAGALFFFPLLPLAYFYAIYRHHLGGFEVRANRAIAVYLFILLLVAVLVAAATVLDARFAGLPGSHLAIVVGVVAASLAGAVTFEPFRRLVERRLLGVRFIPAEIAEGYATRIAASLDVPTLVQVLRDEIAPSLMVRQSALIACDHDRVSLLYTDGVPPELLPAHGHIPALEADSGKMRVLPEETASPCPWARVALPLAVNRKTIGLWLLGRRDPDDHYSPQDITFLRSLSSQTAIALSNINQAERLRALYKNDVDQREAERASLARELHDNILNHLGALRNVLPEEALTPRFDARYADLADRLRHTITGLRPAALNYGLPLALADLVDLLADTGGDDTPDILLELNDLSGGARCDPQVELHLYRIVQQACDNAIRHGRARRVAIRGCVRARLIALTVEDDGVGFDAGRALDLSHLIAHKHYGLAGMFERAHIIGADIEVDSAPGRGARIQLTWSDGGS